MSIADFAAARRLAPSPLAMLARAVIIGFVARRSHKAKEASLQSLLFAPNHQLRDLGISREELLHAMEIHRK